MFCFKTKLAAIGCQNRRFNNRLHCIDTVSIYESPISKIELLKFENTNKTGKKVREKKKFPTTFEATAVESENGGLKNFEGGNKNSAAHNINIHLLARRAITHFKVKKKNSIKLSITLSAYYIKLVHWLVERRLHFKISKLFSS